jgi:osmotically-inducible protein OsmY
MEPTRSALRLKCPVRFKDRWQGRLTVFEVDDDWSVINLVVSRGIFRRTDVKLPFASAMDWNDDVSLDCTSYEAFGRRIPPVAAPPRPFSPETPLSAGDARLAGAMVERASRRVSHLLFSRKRRPSDQRLVPVQDVSLEGGVIMLPAQWHALSVYRRDSELAEAARNALVAHRYLTADDRRALKVEVIDAVAHVSGNVRTPRTAILVRETVASVPGIADVRSAVVDDRQLEFEIGRALDAAGLFRHGRIYVRATRGEVTLDGFVPAEAVISDVLRVVSSPAGVRSIEHRIVVEKAAPPAAAAPLPPAAQPAPASVGQNQP